MIPPFWKIPKNCLSLSQLLLGPTLILGVRSCPLSMTPMSPRARSGQNFDFLAQRIKKFYYYTISRFWEKSRFQQYCSDFPDFKSFHHHKKSSLGAVKICPSNNLSGHMRHYFLILYGSSKKWREKKFSHGCLT